MQHQHPAVDEKLLHGDDRKCGGGGGGDKSTLQRDIKSALKMARELKQEKRS